MRLPIVCIPHPGTRINHFMEPFLIPSYWIPVLSHGISIQTPPRHAICCPRTLNPLRRRGKRHSARRGLLVVVLHSHNNNRNFHDVLIQFHQKMFPFRQIDSAIACTSLLDRQHFTFRCFPGATGHSGAVSWGAPIFIFATSL